jgi:hypothetical protein
MNVSDPIATGIPIVATHLGSVHLGCRAPRPGPRQRGNNAAQLRKALEATD